MSGVVGRRFDPSSDAALADAITALADEFADRPAGSEQVVLLPDAHYPYHPSTGMVTDPDVVAALADELATRTAVESVDVALPDAGPTDPSRAGTLLGYDELADREDLSVSALDSGPEADGRRPGDASLIPDRLADAAVVVVPSLRAGNETALAGAVTTLVRAAGGDPTDAADVHTALRVIDPVAAVADGTYAFAGEPRRAGALLAGADPVAVDRVAAALLSVDPDADPALAAAAGERPVDTRGFDFAELRSALPTADGGVSEDGPGELVRTGYRLYTMVSGDAYPPQFRGER